MKNDKTFNIWYKKFISCNESEEFCKHCKGRGGAKTGPVSIDMCMKCNGEGKLDWISKIINPSTHFYKVIKTKCEYGTHELSICKF